MADYLFGSANVRTLENAIIGRERLSRLLETRSLDEAYALLAEYGVRLQRDGESGVVMREATLLDILRDAYCRVAELASDSEALALWRYPYDCNNIKAAIKCASRGIEPYSMMFDFGTVPVEQVVKMIRKATFEALPKEMGVAAKNAIAIFAKTKDPQTVDLTLDRACYADMLAAAKACKNEYVCGLVTAKIDLTNLMMLLRILRMRSGEAGRSLLSEALLDGGILAKSFFAECYTSGEETLLQRLKETAYADFAGLFRISDRTPATAERLADNILMTMIKEAKWIPVGLEVMVAFLLAHEYEVKNLRIVLAGKEAGVSTQIIRERIRESYV